MPRVVFWSPDKAMNGATHAIIAVSTFMGITHKATCLLMQGHFNSKKIESSYTPYDELIASGAFDNANIGASALIRLATSNKLTSDAIKNYAKPVLKERLDVLYGINSKERNDYEELTRNLPYITRKASEAYDLVFIDLPKGSEEKFKTDTLSDSEVVVCVVNQDEVKLSKFFESINSIEELKDKTKIVLIADYEENSKYNAMNIKTKYKVKDPIYVVPHNFAFSDACNSGNVVDFFYKNINADSKDYNGYFISQVKAVVDKIFDLSKIRDN